MHKERIFSASSGRHRGGFALRQGTWSLVRCAFTSFFLALCSYSHPSIPLSPFCVHRRRRGGGRTERSLFLWNARARARRAERPRCFRAARPVLGRAGPSGIAGPVFFSLLSFRRCFRFFSRPLRPVSVSLFYCALRNALPGAPAAPLRCVVLRPARCLPRHFSLSSVRSIFPAPLSSSPPPCFAPCPPRRRFRPVLGACSAFLLFPVRRFSRRPRGLTG